MSTFMSTFMRMFDVKRWETKGILGVDIDITPASIVNGVRCGFGKKYIIGLNLFLRKKDAINQADRLRKKRIANLKKRIKKLESMKFE
jgi:hypothetical protein